jgi:tetratricopeptide (TPR) repeat protein
MATLLETSQRNRRYPRSRKFRLFRGFLRFWWFIFFIIYVPIVISNLFTLLFDGGFSALQNSSKLTQALLLDQLLPFLVQHPLAIVPAILLLSLLIFAGHWAHRDHEDERRILHEREESENRVALLGTQFTVREQAHTTLQSHLENQLPSPKPVEEAVPEVLGPPSDEVFLPVPAHFVGRSSDLEWLLSQLHKGSGVIALRGLGGIGKTALASVAVRQMREAGYFRDGVAVLFCQGFTDAADMLRRILTRFDLQRRQPRAEDFAGLVDTAHQLLENKETLVVLDNVEPELSLEKVVAPLQAARTTVLLTARQVLPSAIVPPEAIRVLGMLSVEETLLLFTQSYGHESSLDLSAENRSAIEHIITILDRHTFAVKLAGAYAANTGRDLKVLVRELEDDPQWAIEMPEGTSPKALALVLTRSVDKLSSEARQLFVALAVFSTTEFSRRAAFMLAKGIGITASRSSVDMLILLALLNPSTNNTMPEESRERLRLHPLLRAFATAELGTWPEEKRFQAFYSLAQYYAEYANKIPDRTLGNDEGNIIGALEWAQENKQYELVASICYGMRNFWSNRWRSAASLRYLPLGVSAAETIYNMTKKLEDGVRSADLALTYGQLLARIGNITQAKQLFEENLAVRIELDDKSGEGRVLTHLALLAYRHGTVEEAEVYFRKSLANARELHKRQAEGMLVSRLGRLLRRRGQLREAEDYFSQALDLTREVHDVREQSVILISLGQAARDRCHLEDALRYYTMALDIAHELQDQRIESAALIALGEIDLLRRDLLQAKAHFDQALLLVSRFEDRQGEGIALARLGELARFQGQFELARNYYERSLSYQREMRALRDESIVLGLLGQLARDRGQLEDAQRYYEHSLSIRREVQDRRGEGIILTALGQLMWDRREMELAEQYYRQGLDILNAQDAVNYAASSVTFGTFLIEEQNKHGEGCQLLMKALNVYVKMQLPDEKEVREVMLRLGCTEQSSEFPHKVEPTSE